MKAVNLHATSVEDLANQLQNTIQAPYLPTLAFVFASVVYDLDAISEVLAAHQLDICGVTTTGEIQDGQFFDDSITVMLLDAPRTDYKILMQPNEQGDTFATAQAFTHTVESVFENPTMLIFSSGMQVDGQQIVDGIKTASQKQLEFYGGLAGDNLLMQNTYTFTNGKTSHQALLAVVFNKDNIHIKGFSTSGWKAVGTEKIVTKSAGNVVYTIDHQPAIEVFERYFNLGKVKETEIGAVIGVRFPLQLLREDGTTVLRAPLITNKEDGSLIFAGAVPEGSAVKFSTVPDFDVIEESIAHAQAFQSVIPEADALLMISCAARKLAFGPMIEDEIQGVQQIWNVPLAGFFAYGEIGAMKNGSCDFHNETISLVVIKAQ